MIKSQKKKKKDAKKNRSSKEHMKDKYQEGSSKKTFSNKQKQNGTHGECEINTVTSKVSLPNNTGDTLEDNNFDSGSEVSIRVEKDEKHYGLKQGIPRRTKFRSLIDIYKSTNRLSSPKDEYNRSRSNTSENKKSEVHMEDKRGKDQQGTFEETLPNKQKVINGEFESIAEDGPANSLNHTMDNNVDKTNDDDTNDQKYEECHVSKGISRKELDDPIIVICKLLNNEMSEECNGSNIRKDQKDFFEQELPDQQQQEENTNAFVDTCEELENEIFEEPNESNIRKDQKDSFEEELLDQQQQDINGESELNKVTCEGSLPENSDHLLNDDIVNYGSKLLTRDEKDGKYHITQGLPRSIKFRSIDNLYKCTNRLSPFEAEFNWNLPTKEDPNDAKEDSSIKTNKKNVGRKRKGRENHDDNKEKDVATSFT